MPKPRFPVLNAGWATPLRVNWVLYVTPPSVEYRITMFAPSVVTSTSLDGSAGLKAACGLNPAVRAWVLPVSTVTAGSVAGTTRASHSSNRSVTGCGRRSGVPDRRTR